MKDLSPWSPKERVVLWSVISTQGVSAEGEARRAKQLLMRTMRRALVRTH